MCFWLFHVKSKASKLDCDTATHTKPKHKRTSAVRLQAGEHSWKSLLTNGRCWCLIQRSAATGVKTQEGQLHPRMEHRPGSSPPKRAENTEKPHSCLTDSTSCWEHSSEILVDINMTASHSCCRLVGCTFMMQLPRSIFGIWSLWRPFECSELTVVLRKQFDMIWTSWQGGLSCWKQPLAGHTVFIKGWTYSEKTLKWFEVAQSVPSKYPPHYYTPPAARTIYKRQDGSILPDQMLLQKFRLIWPNNIFQTSNVQFLVNFNLSVWSGS